MNPSGNGTGDGKREGRTIGRSYGVLGRIGEILAPKVRPGSAAILIVGVIGAVVVIATAFILNSIWVLLALLVLLGYLAWLISRQPGDADGGMTTEPLAQTQVDRPEVLDSRAADIIRRALTMATVSVADRLHIAPVDDVRANLFQVCNDNHLRMCPEVAVRMTPDELTIKMPLGYGATGSAAANGKPKIRRGKPSEGGSGQRANFGDAELEPAEAAKAHPRIAWIISAPFHAAARSWVVNVDGLVSRSEGDLRTVMDDVLGFAGLTAAALSK